MDFKTDDYECKSVKLITGEQIIMSKKRVIGRCHNKIHPGILTQKLFEKHECIGKSCVFFERNECASYWKYLEQREIVKEKKRKKKEEEKTRKKAEATKLAELQETLQQLMKQCGYFIRIVGIKQTDSEKYTVFYTSQRAEADEHCYPNFLHKARKAYPGITFAIKHIQDVDGHYVTANEYKNRVKQ